MLDTILIKTQLNSDTIELQDREIGYTAQNKTLWVGETEINPDTQIIPFDYSVNYSDFDANLGSKVSVTGKTVVLDILAKKTGGTGQPTLDVIGTIPPELAPKVRVGSLFLLQSQNAEFDFLYCFITQGVTVYIFRHWGLEPTITAFQGQIVWGI